MHKCLLLLCAALSLNANAQCTLNALPIVPLDPGKRDIYIGTSAAIEVRFINEKEDAEPDAFPEPPMTITQLSNGVKCAVDGGIWLRKAVYLSADGKTLMTQEYSGSSDQLNFYDTRSCRKIGMLDVSNAKWTLDKGTLQVLSQHGKAKTIKLNQSCTITAHKK